MGIPGTRSGTSTRVQWLIEIEMNFNLGQQKGGLSLGGGLQLGVLGQQQQQLGYRDKERV